MKNNSRKKTQMKAWMASTLCLLALLVTQSNGQEKPNSTPGAVARPPQAAIRSDVKVTAAGSRTNAAGQNVSWQEVELTPLKTRKENVLRHQPTEATLARPPQGPSAGPAKAQVSKAQTKREAPKVQKAIHLPERRSLEATQGMIGGFNFKDVDGKRVYWSTNADALVPPSKSQRLEHRKISKERLAPLAPAPK
jgi:hypothetical protein